MVLITLVLSAFVQDQIDNPEYKGWASSKPGSTVTYKYLREGTKQESEQKTTLKSMDDNEAVTETTMTKAGKILGKPTERKIPAKLPAAQGPQDVKEGEEEIEIGGKKLKCKTREFEKKLPSGKTGSLKFWIHEDLPGMVAKVETTTPGSPKITMIAFEWEKK